MRTLREIIEAERETARPYGAAHDIVAATIGGTATGEQVDRVLEYAVDKQLLFHGIKRAAYVDDIRTKGVFPLTPEGRFGSFWASGNQLFYHHTPSPDTMLWGYDSSFFHYAQSYTGDGSHMMALAITDMARLQAAGIEPVGHKPNGDCTIREVVEPSLITLVTVTSMDVDATRQAAFGALVDGIETGRLLRSGEIAIET